jgi:hypothetical protein
VEADCVGLADFDGDVLADFFGFAEVGSEDGAALDAGADDDSGATSP